VLGTRGGWDRRGRGHTEQVKKGGVEGERVVNKEQGVFNGGLRGTQGCLVDALTSGKRPCSKFPDPAGPFHHNHHPSPLLPNPDEVWEEL
jgi:hypothetical protein